MQALSFAVHIPLVCFGISFPIMVLFAEWLYLRTGDRLYLTLARRWTRLLVTLFAVGVITGTVLSFEMGLLWPGFTGRFGSVFGLGFAIEGFSFFMEAIFIGIYVYGWARLSPRAHLLAGIPIVLTGFTGSLMVIAVNGWMQHPGGFRLRAGRVVDVDPFRALFDNTYLWHELIHMYVTGYVVTGFVLAGRVRSRPSARAVGPLPAHGADDSADDRSARGDRRRTRRRLGGTRRGQDPAGEAGGDRGPLQDHPRGIGAHPRLVHERPGQVRDRDPASALAAGDP